MRKNKIGVTAAVCAALALMTVGFAHAQQAPIERVKLSDNEMTCAQLHAETEAMDKVAAEARAAESDGNTTANVGQAGSVAAEVAGRSGLFGSFGGLAGALFGQLATQTAANVAQQSGRMTAAQAAERSKQAMARKENVSTLFLNKGCRTSDLAYNPPASAQAPLQMAAAAPTTAPAATPAAAAQLVAIAPAAPVRNLPDLDPDKFFKGKAGGTFGKSMIELLPASRRVAIAGFRVAFVTSNTASAQVRGSYMPGRETSGASFTLKVNLSGVDTATMQAVTDRAYRNFLDQMRLAGREIVPQEEMREFFAAVDLAPTSPGKPYFKEAAAREVMVFSPTSMPLWFHHVEPWTDRGMLDQKNYKVMGALSQKLNVAVIAPLIELNFAQMSSSGNQSGLVSNRAEADATMEMNVSGFFTPWLRSDEFRNNMIMKGDEAAASMQGAFTSDLKFADMKEVAASNNSAATGIGDALGRFGGLGGVAGGARRGRSERLAETSNAAFAAAASDALTRATGTFARWFQKYPAR